MHAEDTMSESSTEQLARFVSTLGYDDIPANVREKCKDVLLDTLACALAGHAGPVGRREAEVGDAVLTSTASHCRFQVAWSPRAPDRRHRS